MMGALDLKFYLSIFFRRLPYFLVVFVLIAAAGISVAMVLPAVYQAQATIAVESEQISDELITSTVATSSIEQIQAIEQKMLARNNLLDLAGKFGVFADAPGMTASERVEAMREAASFNVINRASFGSEGLITFTIAFTSGDADTSANVVNDIVSQVLEENVRLRTGRATDTLRFFQAEVERLSGILGEISAEIVAFQNENADRLPDSLTFRRNEQTRLQTRLLRLEQDEASLRTTRARLVEVFETRGSLRRPRDELSPEELELETVRNDYERQRVVLSETNPRLVLLKTRLDALERIVANQRRAPSGDGETIILSDLDLQLETLDARLEDIDGEQARLEAQLAELDAGIRATPEVALRLSTLERRQDDIQQQYSAAQANLSTAATGERLEVLSKGERFEVIETATPPQWPTSPNRKLLAAASVAAGIAAGLGLIVLLELLNRAIRRPVEITNALGIQTFGTIPYVRTRRERVVKQLIIISLLLLFVIGVPAAIWAVHTYYLPLDLLIEKAADKLGLAPYIDLLF